ncbi:MAG: 2-oxoacid:acceptor oxidoreductase subunit alpha [Gammaproteobacteria bacterium AqS3]|nr:2-oxoacid:acceptor oxidoreductase subunit alpha [Gammaproteobacteria bacterium AqS3]
MTAPLSAVNEFVVCIANVNGTGSASANALFAKAVFAGGVPVAPKNIFPSNIQGLPTWFEVRISEAGHLGRRGDIDIMVGVNAQSLEADYAQVRPGGYFLYDSTKQLPQHFAREDITHYGVPLTALSADHFSDMRQRQLLSNTVYVGALAALFGMDLDRIKGQLARQFAGKERLIDANALALDLGHDYVRQHYGSDSCGLKIRELEPASERILMTGNSALGLGAVYAGATVMAWYPITPSTSVAEAFEAYCRRLRRTEDGEKRYAVIQAEDELAALGMVIGANWNGARGFTATSGPGISLMNEFFGLAYFAEVPAVVVNVQRAGPSTGMPTRTQQSDVLLSAYASHGDTKHPLLFPSDPAECFTAMADAFDLADRAQTPVLVMVDLDLGMNEYLSAPLAWPEGRSYDRGKVLDADALENLSERYGRYLDVDGDGIAWRTWPGSHPDKGAFFTRGTSRDRYAAYTERSEAYSDNMERLLRKWETIKTLVPEATLEHGDGEAEIGLICYGTSLLSTLEAVRGFDVPIDVLRLRAFPFSPNVGEFIARHRTVMLIEQNRDAQMRTLLVNELEIAPGLIHPVLHYDGMPIPANTIAEQMQRILRRTGIQVLDKEDVAA